MYSKRHVIGIIVLLLILGLILFFSGPPAPPEKPKPKSLPNELIEPCIGKEEGDSCTVEGLSGNEENYCQYVDEELVCFSHRMPPSGESEGEMPPPEE